MNKLHNKNDGATPKKGFSRFKPALSKMKKPAKILAKTVAAVAFTATVAIGGANLGTYFDYVYNNHDYASMGNRTRFEAESQDPLMEQALETARVPIVGANAPEEAQVHISLETENGTTTLSARYVMVWSTNRGVEKRDEEEMNIYWTYDDSSNRFIPDRATTRFHYRTVEYNLSLNDAPVIVIQNPAHTPGIPGPSPRYEGEAPGVIDVFTMFAGEKWAGSSLSLGLPNEFRALQVSFSVTIN